MAAGTIWFNWRVWARQRAVAQGRAPMPAEAFAAALAERGVSSEVAAVVRELAGGYFYVRGATPRPEDSLGELLCVTPDEVEEMVELGFARLGIPLPADGRPARVPALATVLDLALYLEARRKAASLDA